MFIYVKIGLTFVKQAVEPILEFSIAHVSELRRQAY
jgi:hypothetical protein